MLRPFARRRLCARVVEASALGGIAGGAVAILGLLAGLLAAREATALWAVLLVPVFACANALRVLCGGASVSEVARLLDGRGGFRERLTTAVELESRGVETPAAAYCCQQARGIVAELPTRLAIWTRTSRTSALLGVVVLLVAGMAALTATRRAASPVDRFVGVLDGATQARREAVAASLREASQTAEDSGAAERLERAATLVELADEAELRRVLGELAAAGFEIGKALPDAMAAEAGLAGQGDGSGSDAKDGTTGTLDPLGAGVAVADSGPAQTPASGDEMSDAPALVSPPEAAWRAVCHRAAALGGSVARPRAYRPLVQAFYAGPSPE